MYENDKLGVMVLMKEHFNKATDGDGELLWNAVKGLDLPDVRKAIEDNRLEKGDRAWRPDINRIRQLAATYRNNRLRKNYQNERVIDGVRKSAAIGGDTRFHELSDVAALMLHFSDAWKKSKLCEDEYGRQGARVYIFNHAKQGFGEVGLSNAEAEEFARSCIDAAKGERIAKPRAVFHSPETPDTSSFAALKHLAVAEREAGAA